MGEISKKVYWWASAGIISLLLLLASLALIVPRVVSSAWLKEKIQSSAAKQLQGDFDFQEAELSLLPVPAVGLLQVSLVIPGTARIQIKTLTVYPRLLPLLVGDVVIAKTVIETPDFTLPIPRKSWEKGDGGKDISVSGAMDTIFTKLVPILSAFPSLDGAVRNGTLRLLAGDEEKFQFHDINASFAGNVDDLTAAISCTSNIWQSMEMQATLAAASRKGQGKISLQNTDGKVLTDYFWQDKSPYMEESFPSLDAAFSFNPETGLTADVQSAGSSFTAQQGNETVTIQVESLKGSLQFSDPSSSIRVDDLILSSPQIQMNGSLMLDHSIPRATLNIASRNADIENLSEVVPVFLEELFGDQPVVRKIFDITRGGTITQANFHVEGKSAADLGVFQAMQIQGQVKNGKIMLADLGLDLDGVTGDISIANGILSGKNIQARLGNSTGSNGTFKLGLAPQAKTPFHLELHFNADLAEMPPLVEKLVPQKEVAEYLGLFENLAGTGQGKMTIGDTLDSLSTRLEVDKISLQADFKPIPYPLAITDGRILHDGLKIQSIDLQGSIGKSTFSHFSSKLNLGEHRTISVESGSFHLVLNEIFPWLATYEKLAEELQDIQTVTGLADVTVSNIQGPLQEPAALQYELSCALQGLDLTSTLLPGPLKLTRGKATITPDKMVFENLHADLLDSSITYSGVLQNFLNGKANAEITVTGAEIGPQLNTWLSKQLLLPEDYNFRTPLLVSHANVKWSLGELLDLQGDFSIRNGPIFFIDIMHNPAEMILRNLALKNENERADISLAMKTDEIEAEFKGSLSKSTIDKILLHDEKFQDAWIKGDIHFLIDMNSPGKSSAAGTLDGGDFIFPRKSGSPISLETFSLAASDNTLTINSAEALLAEKTYVLHGQAVSTAERLAMDFDVRTDSFELDKIITLLQEDESQNPQKTESVGKDWYSVVQANINLHADTLRYKSYIWKPLESRITYEDNVLGIEVLKAELCNISTPGKISYHDGKIAMDFTMEAKEQEFQEILICLEGGQKQMTGLLNLKAHISGQGTSRDEIVNSLKGDLKYSSKDGYIYHDAHLAKVLSLLNVTNLFKGQIPDMRTTGFHYDSLFAKGAMEKGILTIAPAKLEAPIMEVVTNGTIDIPREKVKLQVLVAPLQTVNKIQKILPIVRSIIPSNIVAVPVEVSGNFSDIKVRVMPMSAITRSVFNVMVDALATPVRIFEGDSQK